MPATTNPIGLLPGEKASAAFASLYNVNLGRVYMINGNNWKVVRALGTLATMGRAVVVASSAVLGIPTTTATTGTVANDVLVLGVCHATQVDLVAGDIFLVQGSGYAEVISAAAIAASVAIGTSTTAKKCDDISITGGGIGVSLESAAGADENVAVRLTIF